MVRGVGVWSCVLPLCVVGVACGGGGGGGDAGDAGDAGIRIDARLDAGPDGGGPTPPAAPEPAALPDFGECPEGWRARETDGARVCEPWARGEGPECPEGEVRLPSEPACARFGSACPDDGWPADLPDAGVLYVDPDADPSAADGTRAAPFAAIAAAVGAASDGDVIALSTGVHEGPVELERPLELRGACAGGTTITASSGDVAAVVTATVADVGLRDVRIEGDLWGLRAHEAGALTVRDVWIEGVQSFGAAASVGGTLLGGPLVVRNTRPTAEGGLGQGIVGNGGCRIELDGVVAEGNHFGGVFVFEEGSEARITDALLRRMVTADGTNGAGAAVGLGAQLVLERTVAEENIGAAVFSQAGGRAELVDVVLRDTVAPSEEVASGAGLSVQDGSEAVVTRALLEHNTALGMVAIGVDSVLTMTDVVVADTQEVGEGSLEGSGIGIGVYGGPVVTADRLLVADCALAAILVEEGGSRATLRDYTALRTRARAGLGFGGRAISAAADVQVRVERLRAEDNQEVAVLASGEGTEIAITDAVITGTESRPMDGFAGRALTVQGGAGLELTRAVLRDNRETAMLAHGEGTEVTLRDVVVAETRERACIDTICEGFGAGMGVSSVRGALVDMERFVVRDHPAAGLQIAGTGRLLARDGEVFGNTIGVNIQGAEPNLEELTDRVYYHDNDVQLDSQELPVPDPN